LLPRTSTEMPERLASVPAFPSVAMKLLSLLNDGVSTLSKISACIATDPVLSGRLIQRANAADQAVYCEVKDVLQATHALGLDITRETCVGTAASVYAAAAIQSETLRPCWHHTLACALASSEVARLCGLRPGEAYTAGILHDIGRLGLLTAYPAEYEEMMAQADGESEDLICLERERFGVDHVEAGAWLARQWNLPESILNAILRHHDAPKGAVDEAAAVQMGCRLADLLGFSVNRPAQPAELDEICAILPEPTRRRLAGQLSALREAVDREIAFLEGRVVPHFDRPAANLSTEEAATAENARTVIDLSQDSSNRAFIITALILAAFLLCAATLWIRQ
jgi:putative nucleotidyltransferase with HDIG domain